MSDKIPMPLLTEVNEAKCSRCGGVKVIGVESCQNHVNRKVKFICSTEGCNNHVIVDGAICLDCLSAALQVKGYTPPSSSPPWHPQYHKILDRCKEIIEQRGKDYNQGSVDMPDYFPFGDKSYFQMLWVKILRLQSLVESDGSAEAKMDSVIDLINYAAFYGIYLTTTCVKCKAKITVNEGPLCGECYHYDGCDVDCSNDASISVNRE